MVSQRMQWRWGLALGALALLTTTARPADDEKALRQRVLELNQITGDDTMRGAILTLIEDKAGTLNLLAVAAKITGEKETPLNYIADYILARSALQLKDYAHAITLYRACIEQASKVKSVDKLTQGFSGLIAIYAITGRYDDGIKACEEFEAIPEVKIASREEILEAGKYNAVLRRNQEEIRRERIRLLIRAGKAARAREIVDDLLKDKPNDRDTMELRALIQRESGDYAAAAKTYEDIIKRANDDIEKVKGRPDLSKEDKEEYTKAATEEIRDYRYILSSLYTDAKQVNKAADVLKGLLKDDPDNAGYNNDLGYIWADHDMNLTEAEKLIRKAIDEDKKKQLKKNPAKKAEEIKANAAYLDSLGWVLYKQKKFKEALPPLQEAIKADEGQSIEIYDHLADVHMALGNKAAALDAWKKGLDAFKKGAEDGKHSKREDERKIEVEKKIKANE
jgi:tetratricopeptide (TPR) repeat protein